MLRVVTTRHPLGGAASRARLVTADSRADYERRDREADSEQRLKRRGHDPPSRSTMYAKEVRQARDKADEAEKQRAPGSGEHSSASDRGRVVKHVRSESKDDGDP